MNAKVKEEIVNSIYVTNDILKENTLIRRNKLSRNKVSLLSILISSVDSSTSSCN